MDNLSVASPQFHVFIRTMDQWKGIFDYLSQFPCQKKTSALHRIYLDWDLIQNQKNICDQCRLFRSRYPETELALSLPPILRNKDLHFLRDKMEILDSTELFSGVLVGNLEGLGFFLEHKYAGSIYADHHFYLWNSSAVRSWDGMLSGGCLPLELNAGEQRFLLDSLSGLSLTSLSPISSSGGKPVFCWEKWIYGRIPMMLSANCVAKTTLGCRKKNHGFEQILFLKDRLGKEFPVLINCSHCMNIIYNSVPLSLHGELSKWKDRCALRLQFSLENDRETKEILDFFMEKDPGKVLPPYRDYTTGHEKRGVQ